VGAAEGLAAPHFEISGVARNESVKYSDYLPYLVFSRMVSTRCAKWRPPTDKEVRHRGSGNIVREYSEEGNRLVLSNC
jgi:hypothetical protein